MLSEGSSVKGSPEDKQPSGFKGSAKISRRVTLAHYTGTKGKGQFLALQAFNALKEIFFGICALRLDLNIKVI